MLDNLCSAGFNLFVGLPDILLILCVSMVDDHPFCAQRVQCAHCNNSMLGGSVLFVLSAPPY